LEDGGKFKEIVPCDKFLAKFDLRGQGSLFLVFGTLTGVDCRAEFRDSAWFWLVGLIAF
jgi:hypothetical protein